MKLTVSVSPSYIVSVLLFCLCTRVYMYLFLMVYIQNSYQNDETLYTRSSWWDEYWGCGGVGVWECGSVHMSSRTCDDWSLLFGTEIERKKLDRGIYKLYLSLFYYYYYKLYYWWGFGNIVNPILMPIKLTQLNWETFIFELRDLLLFKLENNSSH